MPHSLSFVACVRRHASAVSTGLCAAFGLAGATASAAGYHHGATALFALAYVAGGAEKAYGGVSELCRGKLNVDLLMVGAAVGAAAMGHWSDGALLIFIFALSGALEDYALGRAERSLASLMRLRPEQACVRRDGDELWIPVAEAVVGDNVIVRSGDRIPLDGEVIEGFSTVDQAAITGESLPVEKSVGSEVFAGTVNGQGFLVFRASRASTDTVFARILKLVEQAQSQTPTTHRFLQRFESIYSWSVVMTAAAILLVSRVGLGWTWGAAMYRTMAFAIVASPCAVMLSSMPAILSALANAARHGILVKGGDRFARLADVNVVAFDKTGTLTSGRLTLTSALPFVEGDIEQDELLRVAASLENGSNHPVANAIIRAAETRGLDIYESASLDVTGQGVSGDVNGKRYHVGGLRHLAAAQIDVPEPIQVALVQKQNLGKSVVLVCEGANALGMLILEDSARLDAAATVQGLRDGGVKRVALMTGDHPYAAREIGRIAGVDAVYSELLPEDKARLICEEIDTGGNVAFVGDGVNDAPALASAHVGIAMGKAGTDVALDTADMVLMQDDLSRLPYAIRLGRKARRIVRQNLAFAVAVIATLSVANLAFGMELPVAVIGHEGSTILVAFNGLRMLRDLSE